MGERIVRWALTLVATALGCAAGGASSARAQNEGRGTSVVMVGAGDIASCDSKGDEATARLLDRVVAESPSAIVFTTGDNAYSEGSSDEFDECYQKSWGRHISRTRPAPGNHDYETKEAKGYFRYFGDAAGKASQGYYSFDAGDWHVVMLNSNIDMKDGSKQVRWLRADLEASDRRCTLAIWHAPRFSSGTKHGSAPETGPLWEVLYENDAEIVLNGHEHHYERFAPQTPAGQRDAARGLREFVVGTGGASHYPFGKPLRTSEVRDDSAFGVLKLTLRPTSYDWEFIPVEGQSFSDSGSGSCH